MYEPSTTDFFSAVHTEKLNHCSNESEKEIYTYSYPVFRAILTNPFLLFRMIS